MRKTSTQMKIALASKFWKVRSTLCHFPTKWSNNNAINNIKINISKYCRPKTGILALLFMLYSCSCNFNESSNDVTVIKVHRNKTVTPNSTMSLNAERNLLTNTRLHWSWERFARKLFDIFTQLFHCWKIHNKFREAVDQFRAIFRRFYVQFVQFAQIGDNISGKLYE